MSLTGEGARNTGQTIRRLFGYLKPYWQRLSIVALLSLVGTLCTLAGPILIGRAIDSFIATGNLDGLLSLVVVMVIVYLWRRRSRCCSRANHGRCRTAFRR